MPIMKPPSDAVNIKYGCVYVDGSIMVADADVASLTLEGWELVYDEIDIEEVEDEELG